MAKGGCVVACAKELDAFRFLGYSLCGQEDLQNVGTDRGMFGYCCDVLVDALSLLFFLLSWRGNTWWAFSTRCRCGESEWFR